jgi:type IX secretion system PorP/SprF family membrane protein
MIMRCLILLIWMAWFVPQICGQDVHATQFYNTPYLINTGLTGQFEGAQRYMLYQRTQWRSITTPYRSFALAGEWKNISLKKIFWKIPNIHSGFTLITDKAGDSQFRTTNLVGQFSMPLLVQQWQIQPSLGLGLLNMHLSDAELTFDRQWTGQIFDPNSSTGENIGEVGYTRFQLNTGISAFKKVSTGQVLLGVGLFNVQRPKQNFITGDGTYLQRRWTLHGQYKHTLQQGWSVEPLFLLSIQGPYQSINPGLRVHFERQLSGIQQAAYVGIVGRSRDAGNIVVGVRQEEWEFGLSYDINVSDLDKASRKRGGLEITAIYILPMPREIHMYQRCRQWM